MMNLDDNAPVETRAPLPAFARVPVLSAAATQVVVLLVVNGRYGYHRDELYFRMLHPAWGYVDQPPLTPLLARFTRALLSDSAWALRLPAVLASVIAILLVAAITREVGGGAAAQALAAWGYAFAAFPLVLGHVLLTNSIDEVVWLATLLCIVRARLRSDDRWWLAAGVVVGLGLYDKWLIVVLLAALAVGIAITGPRRLLIARPVLVAVVLALVVGLPNLIFQIVHGWPQISFGRALAEHKSGETRTTMWPLLLLMLGPPLTPIWVSGAVAAWRRPEWRPIRFVAAAFPVLLLLVFAMGTQPTYPLGLVAALYAIGCVPTARWWRAGRGRRSLVVGAVVVNSAVAALISLPLVPVDHLGETPIPGINQTARDTVGWPAYVREVGRVYRQLPADEQANLVIIASNYGEAGAIDRYGPDLGLPRVYSPQNQLYFQARPPDRARTVIFVGGEYDFARGLFADCVRVDRLDNAVGVDNEEQGEAVGVCRDPRRDWRVIWARLKHED